MCVLYILYCDLVFDTLYLYQ